MQEGPLDSRPNNCDAPLPGVAGIMPMAVRIPTVGVPPRLQLHSRATPVELIARPSSVPLNTPFAAFVHPRAVGGIFALGGAGDGGPGPPPLPPGRACPAHITLLLGVRQKRLAGLRPAASSAVAPWHAPDSPARAGGVLGHAPPTLCRTGVQPYTSLSTVPLESTGSEPAMVVHPQDISDLWHHSSALQAQCIGCVDIGSR
jgi:hypothetical protein